MTPEERKKNNLALKEMMEKGPDAEKVVQQKGIEKDDTPKETKDVISETKVSQTEVIVKKPNLENITEVSLLEFIERDKKDFHKDKKQTTLVSTKDHAFLSNLSQVLDKNMVEILHDAIHLFKEVYKKDLKKARAKYNKEQEDLY